MKKGNFIYKKSKDNQGISSMIYLTNPCQEFCADVELNKKAFIKSISRSGRVEGIFEDNEDLIWSCMDYELPLFFNFFPI